MDTPNILDYGADPTGVNSSADALAAMIADINTEGLANTEGPVGSERAVGYFPTGTFVIDRYCGSLLNGSIIGVPAYTGRGTRIIIPKWAGMVSGVGADDNWMRFGNGTVIRNFYFEQPDQVDSKVNISVAGSTGTGEDNLAKYAQGAAVLGSPDTYPAIIQSEHFIGDDLTPVLDSKNGGRIVVEKITFKNVFKFLHVGDDTAEDQAGISGVKVQDISGFCLYEDFVLRQVGGTSSIRNVDISPIYWPEESKSVDQLFMLWVRRNRRVITLANGCVGLDIDNFGARLARYGLIVKGGGGAPVYEDTNLLDGDPGGKVSSMRLDFGAEQVQTYVLIEPDGYMHRCNLSLSGHAVDDADLTADGAVIEILTDREIAGSVSKEFIDPDINSPDDPGWLDPQYLNYKFKTIDTIPGFQFVVDLRLQESSGPLLRSNAHDGHVGITIRGEAIRVGQNTTNQAMFQIKEQTTPTYSVSSLRVLTENLRLTGTRGSAQAVFEAPNKNHLRCVATTFNSTPEITTFPIDHSDTDVFAACIWEQRPTSPEADELEPGD